ncbi:hypothetical protein MKW94_004328, partial [Papaver nudicaule]|nr:hypothetical protein [Papaver nudicaule]
MCTTIHMPCNFTFTATCKFHNTFIKYKKKQKLIISAATGLSKNGISFTDLRLDEIVDRQSRQANNVLLSTSSSSVKGLLNANYDNNRKLVFNPIFLDEAYERCRNICAAYAKTFYLGTLLMTEERQKAIWSIYVWCRRTDELVDGPNAAHLSDAVLDRWEERLENIFHGCPYDMLDTALTDTPFKDMIEGMRMDTRKCRYQTFDELYLYCYYVAGTVGLMSAPVMGVASDSLTTIHSIYEAAALNLGIGNQLTNILRDV